jgi:hypothetical protein
MSGSTFFSGPPSNKATASTVAAAVATLFWTIAAHTFWKSMNTVDLTLYIATSTVIVTALVGFVIPESDAYTQHNSQRLAARKTAQDSTTTSSAISPAIQALEESLQRMQTVQNAMAARLGMAATAPIQVARR